MSEQSSSKDGSPRPYHIVVGSGPAGVSCAKALLKRGCTVHMLDAGITLDRERAQLVEGLKGLEPEQWDPAILSKLKEGMDPGASGLPDKRTFGSDYPHRDAEKHLGIIRRGVGLRPSFALGGLSTVWGATMLPYRAEDIPDWPISIDALAPHYESVLDFAPLSGEHDGLSAMFPPFTRALGRLEPSRQAKAMLDRMASNEAKLKKAGFHHGRARVGIKAARGEDPGCRYCGLCMYGCPYGYIYKSDDTIAQLKASGHFKYEPDVVVAEVREEAGGVTVAGHHRISREPREWKAQRVYLAAGAIPTTRILLRSMSAFDRPTHLEDSQCFLLPALLLRHVPRVQQERLHTLSQVFIELLDPKISPYTVHLQVYWYSDLIGQAVRKTMGPLARPLDFVARRLEGRLLVIQGYLHSTHSSRIETTLRRETEGETLELKSAIQPGARRMIRRVLTKLLKHSRQLGMVPLPMLLQIGEPGRSFHAGGSFPMRANPSGFETDAFGTPAGWKRTHAVDAAVFPSIPSTTITFSVMANAHRIAWETALLQ